MHTTNIEEVIQFLKDNLTVVVTVTSGNISGNHVTVKLFIEDTMISQSSDDLYYPD